jgi:hypothetical protein
MSDEASPCLLVLICDTEIRDPLVDWLLSYHQDVVFSSEPIDCHGMDPDSLNLAEQVTGRQGKLLIQIQTSVSEAHQICRELASRFARAPLRYWIQPVLEAGVLGEPDAASCGSKGRPGR